MVSNEQLLEVIKGKKSLEEIDLMQRSVFMIWFSENYDYCLPLSIQDDNLMRVIFDLAIIHLIKNIEDFKPPTLECKFGIVQNISFRKVWNTISQKNDPHEKDGYTLSFETDKLHKFSLISIKKDQFGSTIYTILFDQIYSQVCDLKENDIREIKIHDESGEIFMCV